MKQHEIVCAWNEILVHIWISSEAGATYVDTTQKFNLITHISIVFFIFVLFLIFFQLLIICWLNVQLKIYLLFFCLKKRKKLISFKYLLKKLYFFRWIFKRFECVFISKNWSFCVLSFFLRMQFHRINVRWMYGLIVSIEFGIFPYFTEMYWSF